jgi:hypothetical protein
MARHPRTADPYRDLKVIDERAPRFNQAFVALLSLAGAITGAWGLLAVVAIQLGLTLALGRRWCLACRLYFDVIQPRIGEGPLEDSRPPRFANQLGLVFTGAGALAGALGFGAVAAALGGMVGGLALLSTVTGFCLGCHLFRLVTRFQHVGTT